MFSRWFNKKKQLPNEQVIELFRKKYTNFKALLESNAELLRVITEIELKLNGNDIFGMSTIRSLTTRVIFHTSRMIKSFENLTNRVYPAFNLRLNSIADMIKTELERKSIGSSDAYTLLYPNITKDMIDWVGGKNANLGEVTTRVGLPIPIGFAITINAFQTVMDNTDLLEEIRKSRREINPKDPNTIQNVSLNIQNLFESAEIPMEVETAILNAYQQMKTSLGKKSNELRVALRSSANQEDSELSFAGQFLSLLNVPEKQLLKSYKKILSSMFSPQAISYRLQMGIPDEDIAMSVACLEMVHAKASGVMFTTHPINVSDKVILINAVWGLGTLAVDGIITPDTYLISKSEPIVIVEKHVSIKPIRAVMHEQGDIIEEPVPNDMQEQLCLTDDQMLLLADYGKKLEAHFQSPQDVEWALNENDELVILQSRPLHIGFEDLEMAKKEPVTGFTLLCEGGEIACPGIGFGKTHVIRNEKNLLDFPEGGVLVATRSSPQYVMLMHKARAIVTNYGSITGHMASLTREFQVPAILNLPQATTTIPHGVEVTVDAYTKRVYLGKVQELIDHQPSRDPFMKHTPVYLTLRKIADNIIPLNLTDPKSPKFTIENCQTIHDMMRLIHEFSYAELFQISDKASGYDRLAVKLSAPIPLDLYLIDLDNGIIPEARHLKKVKPEHITSIPFAALLKGMLHEDVRYIEPKPVDFQGFFSVMSEQMLTPPHHVERFGDKSYAIISEKYLNFSSRVGYHYSILDVYCGQTPNKNYINFKFKGGAADDVRRNRRVRLIRIILEAIGFLAEVEGDMVIARYAKDERQVIEEKLDYLGRLLQFTRQMDMLMKDESSVIHLSERFLKGIYHFDH